MTDFMVTQPSNISELHQGQGWEALSIGSVKSIQSMILLFLLSHPYSREQYRPIRRHACNACMRNVWAAQARPEN